MSTMAQQVQVKESWSSAVGRARKTSGKESIHSGHFMISDFEAEAQDDEDELAVPVPEVAESKAVIPRIISKPPVQASKISANRLSIETSLTKLFQCMSIAYRQKLTSPKWNRFKGVRLRWKDKIRLNNVIWRCWHMQFINKQSALVCQFASPLDESTHNKPEAIVLEGKYWKRKLHAVTAEYKKWRMFSHNQILGRPDKYGQDLLAEFEASEWQPQASDCAMMVDEDYMSFMSDTLFSTIAGSVPFHFPDHREIARGTNIADFIQPSLVQLQPSLDEFMDIEPLNDLLCTKLTSVSEELPLTNYPKESAAGSSGSSREMTAYSPESSSSYQAWYLPPAPTLSGFRPSSGQALYQSAPPPPPPPTPPHKDVALSPAKPKLKHRARSSVNLHTRKVGASPPQSDRGGHLGGGGGQAAAGGELSPPAPASAPLSQSLPSSSAQSSALLEQLLTSNSSSLYGFLESPSDGSSPVPKLAGRGGGPSGGGRTLEVSYLSSYDQMDSPLHLYHSTSQGTMVTSGEKTYALSPENSCLQPSSPEASSSPTKISLLSPLTPPIPSKGMSSCPESPSGSHEQLTLSPLNVGSPSSPKSGVSVYKEHRRVCHINAEQKRRCNIKNGFDTLHSLIPQLNQNPNAKMSKAAMLQKGADYIVQLRNERSAIKQEMESLKQQIESLNSTICNCQSLLPVTGAPVSRHRSNKMKDMFKQYVRTRTHENWKFWILSLIFEPLLESFNNNVSTNSIEDLYHTTLQWVDQHCSLVDLRPVVLNALRQLCTSTEVLSEPGRLPAEARAAVDKSTSSGKKSSNSHH